MSNVRLRAVISENQPYNAWNVKCLVSSALLNGNKVIINADW